MGRRNYLAVSLILEGLARLKLYSMSGSYGHGFTGARIACFTRLTIGGAESTETGKLYLFVLSHGVTDYFQYSVYSCGCILYGKAGLLGYFTYKFSFVHFLLALIVPLLSNFVFIDPFKRGIMLCCP